MDAEDSLAGPRICLSLKTPASYQTGHSLHFFSLHMKRFYIESIRIHSISFHSNARHQRLPYSSFFIWISICCCLIWKWKSLNTLLNANTFSHRGDLRGICAKMFIHSKSKLISSSLISFSKGPLLKVSGRSCISQTRAWFGHGERILDAGSHWLSAEIV